MMTTRNPKGIDVRYDTHRTDRRLAELLAREAVAGFGPDFEFEVQTVSGFGTLWVVGRVGPRYSRLQLLSYLSGLQRGLELAENGEWPR